MIGCVTLGTNELPRAADMGKPSLAIMRPFDGDKLNCFCYG